MNACFRHALASLSLLLALSAFVQIRGVDRVSASPAQECLSVGCDNHLITGSIGKTADKPRRIIEEWIAI